MRNTGVIGGRKDRNLENTLHFKSESSNFGCSKTFGGKKRSGKNKQGICC